MGLRTYKLTANSHDMEMTYQGARSRPAESETKRYFSVSKIRLDDQGFATHVLWNEVDSKSNLDVADPMVVPVSDVVDAILDSAEVRVVFLPPHPPLPDETLEVIVRPDGGDTIALARRSGISAALQPTLGDIAKLGDHAQVKKHLFSFSSRRRAHGVYAVSRVGLDPEGRVTHVQWGRVDTATNSWMGAEAVSPVAEAVAALQAGDQVFALFESPDGHLPGRQFTLVAYDDGRQTIVLQGDPKTGQEIHDMDRLNGTVTS